MSVRVVVIGAGIGGLCLAQGLRAAGVEVRVYERTAQGTTGSRAIASTSTRPAAGAAGLLATGPVAAFDPASARSGSGYGFASGTSSSTLVTIPEQMMAGDPADPVAKHRRSAGSCCAARYSVGLDDVVSSTASSSATRRRRRRRDRPLR